MKMKTQCPECGVSKNQMHRLWCSHPPMMKLPIISDAQSQKANGGSLERAGSMPLVINLSPRESECAACGKWLVDCRQGIPMYEGEPVPHDWSGEWVGRDVCIECFYAYTGAQAVEKNLREWWQTVRQRVASNAGTQRPGTRDATIANPDALLGSLK